VRIAYAAVHYGRDYFAWSLRSIQDLVDEIHVLYSERPSFGYQTGLACPDFERDLMTEAHRFLRPDRPLHWHRGGWRTEGEHRNEILRIARERGADLILSVDTDEVWDRAALAEQLDAAQADHERDTLVPFVHFWRSFGHVCSDPSRPVRIIKPSAPMGSVRYAAQRIPVLHFGYAQSETLIRYKIAIHGHRAEWRSDWLDGKFLPWKPGELTKDVHPTCGWNSSFGDFFWNVRKVDQALVPVLDATMSDHPYKNLELIR
jgi:hypothetical protein